jgi:hypothetical protein
MMRVTLAGILLLVSGCSKEATPPFDGGVDPLDAGGSTPDAAVPVVDAGAQVDCPEGEPLFNVVLGRPTATTIAASVLVEPGTQLFFQYGKDCGLGSKTSTVTATGDRPLVTELAGLAPDSRYFYRLHLKRPGASAFDADNLHSFHTQRSAGTSFSFGLQGDSHPERAGKMFADALYRANMRNAASRRPDFYFAIGDDFSIERLLEKNALTLANVEAVYLTQRTYFGLLPSSAVFLVNGNHEQAAGYVLSGAYPTADQNGPIFAGQTRNTFYPLPAPDAFYSGDQKEVAGIGQLRDYYAWEWGDALFVVLDPYWHSPVPADTGYPGVTTPKDQWEISIGDEQYAWLVRTLEQSKARFKFVFEHHALGGGRGGVAMAHWFEWGGYDTGGHLEFAARRPTWARPIHQLMKETGVTIFFFGHDHLYAREKLDGIVYQSLPNPADNTYTAFNADAYAPATVALPGSAYEQQFGQVLPNSGFLNVTVAPAGVRVEYVRAVLPGDETLAGASNGVVADEYFLPAK